jgi:hypothetical protein
MTQLVYRKRGAVVRYESGVIVRSAEAGEAIEDGETFRCAPFDADPLPPLDSAEVERVASRIAASVPDGVRIERLIISEGIAEHVIGETRWREESRRVHLSMVKDRLRAIVDLGTFDAGGITHVAHALERAEEKEREAPPRLVLAPPVAAALLPALAGAAPPNVELWQSGGGIDGRGLPIEERRIDGRPYPNWYRPSYRIRPLRVALDLRARCAITAIEPGRARAIALLAPVHGLVLRVLVEDGERTYPANVRITRIDAVSNETVWYPYGGGSFGAEMML